MAIFIFIVFGIGIAALCVWVCKEFWNEPGMIDILKEMQERKKNGSEQE